MKQTTDLERSGLEQMYILNEEFLESKEGSKSVRSYLSTAITNETLMLRYLRGRKYRPKYAWETLKRKAEIRFDQYPEIFDGKPIPQGLINMELDGHIGVLKGRDKLGRRILLFRGSGWNTDEFNLEQLTTTSAMGLEHLLYDDDAINNGIVAIQDCEGLGMSHVKQYTLPAMLRLVNIIMYAFPVKFKGLYFINVPFYMMFLFGIIRPFLTRKIKDRLHVSTQGKKLDHLYETVSPKILPKFLGGDLEDCEAVDRNFSYDKHPGFI